MKLLRIISGIAILIIVSSACKKDNSKPSNSINQKVLFQVEYLNYAWGYRHYGWLVDSDGNVCHFNQPKHWNFCDSTKSISSDSLISNLSQTDSIYFKIGQDVLKSKSALIQSTALGEITKPEQLMFDAGITQYSCFTYNSEKKIYTKVLIKQIGDTQCENTSTSAVELYTWMQSINVQVFPK